MRPIELRWPFRDRLFDISWVLFAIANLVAMLAFPAWETVPFHFIWVSLTIVYGFRVWRTRTTVWTIAVVIILTGTAIARDVRLGEQPLDEMTEVPLMAAMFVGMVWHARRRLVAMREVQRVSDANRRLLQREKRFVQDASHQLRTPITIALGHAQLIERSTIGQTSEDAHVVVEELLRLRRLGDVLLEIAAGEERGVSTMAEVDLDAMVEKTLRRWASTPRDWRHDALERATVVGDPDQLQMVVDELIENAVAHTEPGESITLGVRRRDGSVLVTVADSGVGIDRRDLDRIFDRFARSAVRSESTRGLGLGLSLVRSVARSHGGDVRVRSSLGEGSVFELVLPDRSGASAGAAAPPSSAARAGPEPARTPVS